MSSDWVTVGANSKPRKHRGGSHATSNQQSPPSDRPPSAAQVTRWCSLVADAGRDVAASPFFSNLKAVLSSAAIPGRPGSVLDCAAHMVMWGLGALDCGLVHIRYQLALVQLLRSLVEDTEAGIEAYDPVFSGLDRAVLQSCSIKVTPHNPQGRHVANSLTLFYLPHCELELTEQLLSANVAAGTLCNVVILGNSFELYRERWELKQGRGKSQRTQRRASGAGKDPVGDGEGCAAAGQAQAAADVVPDQQQQAEQQPVGGGEAEDEANGWFGALARADGLMYDLCCCGGVEEWRVSECSFPVASAFNDMALHVFVGDWRERLAHQRGLD